MKLRFFAAGPWGTKKPRASFQQRAVILRGTAPSEKHPCVAIVLAQPLPKFRPSNGHKGRARGDARRLGGAHGALRCPLVDHGSVIRGAALSR